MLEREKNPEQLAGSESKQIRNAHHKQWQKNKRKNYLDMLDELSEIDVSDLTLPEFANDQVMVSSNGSDFESIVALKKKLILIREKYQMLAEQFAEPALASHVQRLGSLLAKITSYEDLAGQFNYNEKFKHYARIHADLNNFVKDSLQLQNRITETYKSIIVLEQKNEKEQAHCVTIPRASTSNKMRQNKINSLNDFPHELLILYASFLDPVSIAALMLVNKHFSILLRDEKLWKVKFSQHFSPAPTSFFYASFKVAYTHHRGAMPKRIAEVISLLTEGDEIGAIAAADKTALKFYELEKYSYQNDLSLLKYLQINHFLQMREHFYKQVLAYPALSNSDLFNMRFKAQWAIRLRQSLDILLGIINPDDQPLHKMVKNPGICTELERGWIPTTTKILNSSLEMSLLPDHHSEHIPIFHSACEQGHLPAVRLFVESDVDVNLTCTFHNVTVTPLMIAIIAGHTNVVEYLVNRNADLRMTLSGDLDVGFYKKLPNKWIEGGSTPLEIAVQMQYFHMIPLLMDGNPQPLTTIVNSLKCTPHSAAEHSFNNIDLETLKLLYHADSNAFRLFFFALVERLDVITWLIEEKKFDPNLRFCKRDLTALHFAAEMGLLDVISFLYSKNADMNALTENNEAPRDLAKDEATSQHLAKLGGRFARAYDSTILARKVLAYPFQASGSLLYSLWNQTGSMLTPSDKKEESEPGMSKKQLLKFAQQTKRI